MAQVEHLLEAFISSVVLLLEAAAALLILIAGAIALWGFFRTYVTDRLGHAARRSVQQRFGRSLLLALDFTIGSDLLKVAQAPTFDAVVVIGLVVLVRVVLTFAIQYELSKERAAQRQAP